MDLYSRAAQIIRNLPQKKGTAEQLKAMALKAGAKPVEFENAQFDKTFKGPTTTDAVAEHFERAQPKVASRMFVEQEPPAHKMDLWNALELRKRDLLNSDMRTMSPEEFRRTNDEIDALTKQIAELRATFPAGKPRYEKYTTPGGENYREIVLQLKRPPDEGITVGQYKDALRQALINEVGDQAHTESYFKSMMDKPLEYMPDRILKQARTDLGLVQGNFSRNSNAYDDEDVLFKPAQHENAHWPQKDVVAHVRMKDRTGPNGEKILHVEELQSDWAQEGRQKGFAGAERSDWQKWKQELEQKAQAVREADEQRRALQEARHKLFNEAVGPAPKFHDYKSVKDAEAAYEEWDRRLEAATKSNPALRQATKDHLDSINAHAAAVQAFRDHKSREPEHLGTVPEHPYVSDTGSWLELALKRVGQEAAQGGYDKVIFTPGQEQADRYSLEKQVRAINWSPDTEMLQAKTINGGEMFNNVVPREKLPQYVGKEVAERLLATEPQVYPGENVAYHTLLGDGLRVGGTGMKTFYDKVLPATANKLFGKQGARVQPFAHTEEDGSQYHAMDVTPEMKREYAGPVPAFAQGGEVAERFIPHGHPEREENLARWSEYAHPETKESNGRPSTFYHGTRASEDFSEFSDKNAPYRGGIKTFVSESPEFASGYAGYGEGDRFITDDARVYPVHIRFENPFDFREHADKAEDFWEETGGIRDPYEIERIMGGGNKLTKESFVNAVRGGSWDVLESPEFVEWLREREGHDAIVMMENGVINYGLFEPTQIKSATGNNGNFDPDNPDITKAEGGGVDDRGVVDLGQARETKRLQTFHKSLREDIADTAQQMSDLIVQHREAGNLPMDIGTRFTTAHCRAKNMPPFRVTGYYVNRRNPEADYGYHVERQIGDNPEDVEKSQIAVRNPRLEALHGPEKWAELQNGFRPFTGLTVAKASGGAIGSEVGEQDPVEHSITAYHGSPHDFDEFDMSKIGTGEGAQAYGHGLYFAEAEPTAIQYRNDLSKDYYKTNEGLFNPTELQHLNLRAASRRSLKEAEAKAYELLQSQPQNEEMIRRDLEKIQAAIAGDARPHAGHMYEVRINAHPDHFLDWEKPIHEQSHILDAVVSHFGGYDAMKAAWDRHQDAATAIQKFYGDDFAKPENADAMREYEEAAKDPAGRLHGLLMQMNQPKWWTSEDPKERIRGEEFYQALASGVGQKAASDILMRNGIKGIKYLDSGSRGSNGSKTRNYVVFDDKLVNVKRKYAQGGEV